MNLTLHINGKDYSLSAEPYTTLLKAIRCLDFHSVRSTIYHSSERLCMKRST